MAGELVQQLVVVSKNKDNSTGVGYVALLKADGTPFATDPFVKAAAQTDVGAVTSVVAAGATPTKAEYDALRVDALATRTVLNSLLAKLRTAGIITT